MAVDALPRRALTLAFLLRTTQVHGANTASQRLTRQVLLGKKRFGAGEGLWNGFGGKVEPSDESIAAAAARELLEESHVRVELKDFPRKAKLSFTSEGSGEGVDVHVYVADRFQGEPAPSDEMVPQWFDVDKIPYDRLWAPESDRLWLPHVLAGRTVRGAFHFDTTESILLKHELQTDEESASL
ncbi:TPA: hypothetical protein N0F65_005442 [Lagenidium giganteum]|uniref:Oxidized purine nucleoside triphosphate hydrolase n=1 Tax=Lagenidium giganteum TaxID=4803 RepID=A0AAV2Z0Z2_9STRA|nr:TPA: hypothetical protein N0F65_005442 [Lagenidium giganteum]